MVNVLTNVVKGNILEWKGEELMKIAVVEDDDKDAKLLEGYIRRYFDGDGDAPLIRFFPDGMDFASDYMPDYDIVFMDIEMPHLDGMETARRIRARDDGVAIVFITNMAQYAVQGYEVNAVDFLLKPVSYACFADRMRKALAYAGRRERRMLFACDRDMNTVRLYASEVKYIEKQKNYTVYHTGRGTFSKRESLSDAAESVRGLAFCYINSGCIVNMSYVGKITQTEVCVGEETLPLARRRRQEFIAGYMRYLSGKGGQA